MTIRLVPPTGSAEPGKLTPEEVESLWTALSPVSGGGDAYLGTRGLWDANTEQLVRFTHAEVPNRSLLGLFRAGYLIASPLTDVLGDKRGLLVRLAREARGDESVTRSVKGSAMAGAFLGAPHRVENSTLVCVAEGLTDTLAVLGWTSSMDGVCVVGAPSRSLLPRLAKELEAAGIPIDGKLFALFVKNDRPKNESRREFVRLRQMLVARGARVVLVATHEEYKDVAAWRQAHPDAEWPPAEVRKASLPEPGDEAPAEERPLLVQGLAVPIPAEVRTEHYAQDFTTLCTLLDDPSHREAVMGGRGEFAWCEMTWRVRYGGQEISDVDLSTIRLGLEAQGRSTDGKPLKFSEEEIAKALAVLARRRPVHPVRDWLRELVWDGHERIEVELPLALGHEAASFAGRLLVRWMVSAVARAFSPGCKVDTVLVLVGDQGDRKSTFFEILAGDWFTDTPVHPGDKDGKLVMREAWIVEWAELEAMRRARDHESIKGFLSARVDLFRAPYAKSIAKAPRHCVIVGTSNPRDYLGDTTGNRRFWTIEVAGRINFDWVRKHRPQLWAEASSIYAAAQSCDECRPLLPHDRCDTHKWWLTDEEEALRAEQNKRHEVQHAWTDLVRDWLAQHPVYAEVSSAQILVEVLDMDADKISRSAETAVGGVMAALGWEKKRRRVPSGGVRWVYVRPGAFQREAAP
ncbi:virulence-associated E family protein [Hyalangium sp.]|uniref:virulence-associated E family protein n=1 Tax=Hyalangium sp. TaxID=2028555 RepID=UPI002D2C6867|nr:virulence-associated E family protein [Hyalangium sp.]HYH96025.1 virulence-associated E family protein [Hyalangium sp.]